MKIFTLSFFVFLCACTAHAAYSSLCERSPFCTKNVEVVEKQQDTSKDFEFHGVCTFGDECMFSLLDKASNRRYWLKLGENLAGISVKKYDKNRQIVQLALPDGTTRDVELSRFEPKIQPKVIVTSSERLTQSESAAVPVPKDARRKFLEIVRDGEK